jgi:nicotinamide-nucleotide adenylyltransferase
VRALLVGRFQPPHRGHLHAIRDAARRHDVVYVGVGSAQHSHTPDNPFTVGERFELLTQALAAARLARVHLFPLPDLHRHAAWVAHVEALLPPFDVVLTNNPLTRRLFAAAGYRVHPVALWRPDACRGREIRRRWSAGLDATPLLTPAVARGLERIRGPERGRALRDEAARGRA